LSAQTTRLQPEPEAPNAASAARPADSIAPAVDGAGRSAGAVAAWVALLRAHAASTRRLSSTLAAAHGLTVNDYEVLLHLARAPGGILRRVDLARRVLLTPSGITRLLEGLERAGLVERARCASDARVVYACLTSEGRRRLDDASCTHVAAIEELFGACFGAEELATLAALLERLGDAPMPGACDPRPGTSAAAGDDRRLTG
jgi:DNA-binding MarR family transcriptional regulator